VSIKLLTLGVKYNSHSSTKSIAFKCFAFVKIILCQSAKYARCLDMHSFSNVAGSLSFSVGSSEFYGKCVEFSKIRNDFVFYAECQAANDLSERGRGQFRALRAAGCRDG